MTATSKSCRGKCGFCPQGDHLSNNHVQQSNQLSRVQWPEFNLDVFSEVYHKFQQIDNSKRFQRVCLQVLNYPEFFPDVLFLIRMLHQISPETPISAAIPPIKKELMQQLKEVGLERIGIALDACTPELFNQIKGMQTGGPYTWEEHIQTLADAVDIFGKGYVTTHFIIGMGESEQQLIDMITDVVKKSIRPGIFCFTPIRGTPMEHHQRPEITIFRRIQLARQLILQNPINSQRFVYQTGQLVKISNFTENDLQRVIQETSAFKTAGCPGCNRPYYTSSPGQEPDGFPRDLTPAEQNKIFTDLRPLCG
jgi:biotin synthase